MRYQISYRCLPNRNMPTYGNVAGEKEWKQEKDFLTCQSRPHVKNSRFASLCVVGEPKELELKFTRTDINHRFINYLWSIWRYELLFSLSRRLGYIPKGLLNCGVYNKFFQYKIMYNFLLWRACFVWRNFCMKLKRENFQIMSVAVLLCPQQMGRKESTQLWCMFPCILPQWRTEPTQFMTSPSSSGIIVGNAAALDQMERMREDILHGTGWALPNGLSFVYRSHQLSR